MPLHPPYMTTTTLTKLFLVLQVDEHYPCLWRQHNKWPFLGQPLAFHFQVHMLVNILQHAPFSAHARHTLRGHHTESSRPTCASSNKRYTCCDTTEPPCNCVPVHGHGVLVHAPLKVCKLQCSSNLKGASRPNWERCAAMLACKGFRLAKGKGTPTSLKPI